MGTAADRTRVVRVDGEACHSLPSRSRWRNIVACENGKYAAPQQQGGRCSHGTVAESCPACVKSVQDDYCPEVKNLMEPFLGYLALSKLVLCRQIGLLVPESCGRLFYM